MLMAIDIFSLCPFESISIFYSSYFLILHELILTSFPYMLYVKKYFILFPL